MPERIRVFVIEDNADYRDGLQSLLNFSAAFSCVGISGMGTEGISGVEETQPDVVLMDIDLPDINGLQCTTRIKEQQATENTQVIMLTILEDEYQVMQAIMAGASGYLLKSSAPEFIMEAIRQVVAGGSPMSPSIARKVLSLVKWSRNQPSANTIELNKRELEVLQGLVDGLTYKMIAGKYFMAVDTVRNYIRSIYEKLQVHSRSEAIVKALKQKLL